MKRSLVVLILLLCTSALAAQPQQLPAGEFRITNTVPGPAANQRYELRMVTNGQNFLAGWLDERTGWEAPRLIVTRLNREGQALDGPSGTGIALGEPWNIAEFSIASDGVDYLVVWRPADGDVRMVRIDGTSGAVTQLPSIEDSGSIYQLSLLWIGDRYVLVHRPAGGEYTEVRALDLDRSGQRTGPDRTIISAGAFIETYRVVPFGTQFLAVWSEEDGGKTYASQIGPAPAVPVLVAESGVISALASSGSTVMAVLSSAVSYERPPQLTTLVLGANGAVIRGPEVAGDAVSTEQRADVTWDGSRFRLLLIPNGAWSVRLATYDSNGGLLESPRTVMTGEIYHVVTASAQGESLAVYAWRTTGSGVKLRLRAQNVANGSSNAPHISMSEPESGLPTVVWRGDHYLSVWLDRYGDRSEAKFMSINPDGTPRGAGVTTFATSAYGEDDRLSVATDGDQALIAWYEPGRNADVVQALLVNDGGNDPSAAMRITLHDVSRVQSGITVHWNGFEYLAVWASQEPAALYGMRIAADGTKLDAQPVQFVTGHAPHLSAVAWNGAHWTVAYIVAIPRDPSAEYLQYDQYVHAVQLTRDLIPTGAPMRLSIAEPGAPRIASRNGEVLVVWGTDVQSYEIYGARIVNGANLDGPTGFRIGAGIPTSVHANDSGFVILEQGGHGLKVQSGAPTSAGKLFSFVPELARTDLVLGGPRPLVVYRAWPTGREQVPQVWARYVSEAGRRRAVRR
jgi:hypothetical protein